MARSTTLYGGPASAGAWTAFNPVDTAVELANAVPIQMDKELPLLNPNVSPFYTLTTRIPKREVGGMTYYNEDYVIVPEFDTLVTPGAAASDGAANTASWVVNDSTIFENWSLVKNMNNGEVAQVGANNTSTDTLTVSAIAGALTVGSVGDVILRLGNAMDEGGGIPANRSVVPSRYTNYTQKTMRPIRITEEAKNSADYHGGFGAHYARLHRSELLSLARDIEMGMLFNPAPQLEAPYTSLVLPADETTNVGITMGFDYFLQTYAPSDNVVEATSLTRSTMFTWLEACAQYTEGTTPTIFASTKFFAALQDFGIGQVQFAPSKNPQTFGLNVGTLVLPVGGSLTARVIPHRMLRERASGDWNYAFFVDFSDEAIKYVYYHGMDVKVKRDVRDGSIAFGQQVDVAYCRWGTQFSLAEKHGRIRFKTWS